MTQKKLSPLTKVAAQMGKKGGKAGTGSSKKRGNSRYYRDTVSYTHLTLPTKREV